MTLNAAVFDLDGTVFNVKKRLDRCLSEGDGGECADPNRAFRLPRDRCPRFWECYLSPKYMYLDEPYDIVVSRIRELYGSGLHIFLISGRLEKKQMEATIDQLRRYRIPYNGIRLMRDHETGLRHEEFKRIALLEIVSKGYNIVEFWDDSPEVIEVAKILIPRAKIVHFNTLGLTLNTIS